MLESFHLKLDDECESCLLGKMTKSPFTGTCERGQDFLAFIHTDVCGPFKSTTRDTNRYYVIFIDDYSRHGVTPRNLEYIFFNLSSSAKLSRVIHKREFVTNEYAGRTREYAARTHVIKLDAEATRYAGRSELRLKNPN